jgi:hypothetical protein
MPPKKAKKGGGKASEPQGEPEHDRAWEKARMGGARSARSTGPGSTSQAR